MKRFLFLVITLLIIAPASGQDRIEKICTEVCNCLGTIENGDSLKVKLASCLRESMTGIYPQDSPSYGDSLKYLGDKVVKAFSDYCPKVAEFLLDEKISQYYAISGSEQAIKSYKAGKLALELKEYSIAEKYFLEAVNANPGWVLPLDYLGRTYRLKEDYKNALLYFAKSLEIFPEGSFALNGQATVFTILNEPENALRNYKEMVRLYPNNIEGYYGVGKTYYMLEDYEFALDNLMYCHKTYLARNSDYAEDTFFFISRIHEKLKEQNRLDIFDRLSEKYNLKIELD